MRDEKIELNKKIIIPDEILMNDDYEDDYTIITDMYLLHIDKFWNAWLATNAWGRFRLIMQHLIFLINTLTIWFRWMVHKAENRYETPEMKKLFIKEQESKVKALLEVIDNHLKRIPYIGNEFKLVIDGKDRKVTKDKKSTPEADQLIADRLLMKAIKVCAKNQLPIEALSDLNRDTLKTNKDILIKLKKYFLFEYKLLGSTVRTRLYKSLLITEYKTASNGDRKRITKIINKI